MAIPDARRQHGPPEAAMRDGRGLSETRIADFQRDGFLHLRGVLGADELAEVRQAADEVIARAPAGIGGHPDYSMHRDEESGRVFLHRVNGMLGKHAAFLHLWGHPRLLAIAESLLGPDLLPVALAMVVKSPGCGLAVPWHRDPAHCRIQHGINLGIYLDDADAENGMLHVVPGSHRRRPFDLAQAVERHGFDLPGSIPVPTRAGDVIIHSENVLHGSRQVRSRRQRRVLYFGVRSVREQLADRGLDLGWVRHVARVLAHAITMRGAAPIGRGEEPYRWQPGISGCDPGPLGELPVALEIHDNNAPSPTRRLRFEDEPAESAAGGVATA
jgi:ectoine hydroxylase-related dioxygenase (phytanoyl-CoA dioxygenase family)